MAAIIKFEDGRAIYSSTLGTAAGLELIAGAIDENEQKLKIWLSDVSDRCAPFLDFDLRGLTEQHRTVFWHAADSAFRSLVTNNPDILDAPNAFSARFLNRLLAMHQSVLSGEPPQALSDFQEVFEFDGQMIDLDELWQ